MTAYIGEFWREGDVWEARVRGVEGIHTFGRTLAKAQHYLREAIAAWFDIPMENMEVTPVLLVGSPELTQQVNAVIAARIELEDRSTEVAQQLVGVARALTQAGLSQRDVAAALGLSHQRVHQILAA